MERTLRGESEAFLQFLQSERRLSPRTVESYGDLLKHLTEKLNAAFPEVVSFADVTPEARAFIVSKGFDPRYGARSLKRAIQTYVEDPICETLMEAGFEGERENTATRIAVERKEGTGELTVRLAGEENNNEQTD